RDRHSFMHGQVQPRDRHRDDRQRHQRNEHRDVDLDVTVDVGRVVSRVFAHDAACYRRYSVGKRKIHTRSTKCQTSPEFSTRLVNQSGLVFQSFAPGPHRYAFTAIPPITWSMCSPVSVKYSARKLLVLGKSPFSNLWLYSKYLTTRNTPPSNTVDAW